MRAVIWLITVTALTVAAHQAIRSHAEEKPRDAKPAGKAAAVPKVEVRLGGPAHKTKGIGWPSSDGTLSPSCGTPKPHEITVYLPSGKKYTLWSKYVLLSQRGGTVTGVTINPLTGLTTFASAIDAADKAARRLKFDDPWTLFTGLKGWRSIKKPPPINYTTKGMLEDRVTLFVEITYDERDEAWACSVNFEFWDDLDLWKKIKAIGRK